MFKKILIPIDNSDYSNCCIDIGISLARKFGSRLVGSHVYAARLHDLRFRQMGGGLPGKYQKQGELKRQRRIHDSLITKGLKVISDSYLDVFERRCREADVPFERKSTEGKNFQVLVDDIETADYDLVIIGALGLGAVKESVIGSVCERVVRRVRTDVLVVKNILPFSGEKIVAAVDGSAHSFGGLKVALALGRVLKTEVEAVSVFDPYFHHAAFRSISGVLSEEAGEIFRFKEQERLHSEIIDMGLAKIYQAHLDASRRIAEEDGVNLRTTLLDGKPFEQTLKYIRSQEPWLLVVGRVGVHSGIGMDIGSTAENLLRLASCHVLISSSQFAPPGRTQGPPLQRQTHTNLREGALVLRQINSEG